VRANDPRPALGACALALALVGCSTTATGTSPTPAPSASASASAAASSSPVPPPDAGDDVVGTVVRFSGGGTSVDVTIGEDNPTTRDLVGRLPTTLRFQEFAGREKIAYPAPGLAVEGSPGSDPEDGDLIYFTPWGNLGFYYDASGIDYSDATIHLGTYEATADQLASFDDVDVTLQLVD